MTPNSDMTTMDPIIGFCVFILGLVTGSFLNVCIVRMPEEKSIVTPRSHCVHCRKTIPWYDNIPIFSYLGLKGRCRFCGKKISPRYVLVELLTGIIFVELYRNFGWNTILVAYCAMTAGLIVATFVDLEHRIIPDEISIGGMVLGLILSMFIPSLHDTNSFFASAGRSLLGILVGGGSIYAMGLIGDFIFKKESMGGGDVKLLGMVGAFLGWKLALLSFFVAPFFGAIFGIIVKLRTKESTIAYGPFLSLGALISLLWGEPLINWIIHGYGLH